jgi:hypothetical protein
VSNLEAHADREIRLVGLFERDSDYGGMIGEAVMELVRVFAAQGHSGGSAAIVLAVFGRVAAFKTLCPVTADPGEWMEVGDATWQNTRQSSIFSIDGGKTHYDIDEKSHSSEHYVRRPCRGCGGYDLRSVRVRAPS